MFLTVEMVKMEEVTAEVVVLDCHQASSHERLILQQLLVLQMLFTDSASASYP
jgi:hypothetical protein